MQAQSPQAWTCPSAGTGSAPALPEDSQLLGWFEQFLRRPPLAFVAGLFDDLVPRLRCARQGGGNGPRPRVGLGIVDRDAVVDAVGIDDREAFDELHRIGVEA